MTASSPASLPLAAGLLAFAVTFLLTPLVRLFAVRQGWVAKPTETRWGRRTVARLGGVAMFAGFFASMLVIGSFGWLSLILISGALLVFGLGLLDDVRRLPPYTKLVCQLLIGCLAVIGGIRIVLTQWAWLSIPLSVLWFVLIMNAFNLLDNMDGLAAGVGAIAAGCCAFHAGLAHQWYVVALAAALCGSCLGFLCFNFPPAKIYMGDSGSHLLGFSLAAFALLGTWRHSTQLLSVLFLPTAVLAVPIFDTCFVTCQRLLHHQHPFVGGTDHVSHRLAILGLTARQTVLALYAVSACLGLLSICSAFWQPLTRFAAWLFVLAGLMLVALYLSRVSVYRFESRQPAAAPSGEAGGPVTRIETMLLHKRRLLEILVDFIVLSGTYTFAHLLRFEGMLSYEYEQLITRSLPILLVIKLCCFMAFRLYGGVWKYLDLSDMIAIVKAVTLGSVLSSFALLFLWRFQGYSRAVLIIDWMLSLIAIGGSRVVERLLDEWIRGARGQGIPTLIVGAGDAGARVLRSLRDDPQEPRRVVGFLDDDLSLQGIRIHGVPVLGSRPGLPRLITKYHIQEVLVAIDDPPGELLRYLQQCCAPMGVTWKIVTAGVTAAEI